MSAAECFPLTFIYTYQILLNHLKGDGFYGMHKVFQIPIKAH